MLWLAIKDAPPALHATESSPPVAQAFRPGESLFALLRASSVCSASLRYLCSGGKQKAWGHDVSGNRIFLPDVFDDSEKVFIGGR